jgi:hypothetical protein
MNETCKMGKLNFTFFMGHVFLVFFFSIESLQEISRDSRDFETESLETDSSSFVLFGIK